MKQFVFECRVCGDQRTPMNENKACSKRLHGDHIWKKYPYDGITWFMVESNEPIKDYLYDENGVRL